MCRIIYFLLCMVAGSSIAAQNGLQLCAEKKNRKVSELISSNRAIDTAGLRKYAELSQEWKQCILGKKMPAFIVRSMNGDLIDTENLKGKIAVINFWFMACPPCIAEMPALNRLVSEYKDSGVVFLGITFEKKKRITKAFLPKHKFDFTVVPDAGEIEQLFGVMEHPAMFIINQQGEVSLAWTGGATDETALTEAYLNAKPIIDELLGKARKPVML